ncbi:hypothetical protein Efla_004783 [Eimeria flavescens]
MHLARTSAALAFLCASASFPEYLFLPVLANGAKGTNTAEGLKSEEKIPSTPTGGDASAEADSRSLSSFDLSSTIPPHLFTETLHQSLADSVQTAMNAASKLMEAADKHPAMQDTQMAIVYISELVRQLISLIPGIPDGVRFRAEGGGAEGRMQKLTDVFATDPELEKFKFYPSSGFLRAPFAALATAGSAAAATLLREPAATPALHAVAPETPTSTGKQLEAVKFEAATTTGTAGADTATAAPAAEAEKATAAAAAEAEGATAATKAEEGTTAAAAVVKVAAAEEATAAAEAVEATAAADPAEKAAAAAEEEKALSARIQFVAAEAKDLKESAAPTAMDSLTPGRLETPAAADAAPAAAAAAAAEATEASDNAADVEPEAPKAAATPRERAAARATAVQTREAARFAAAAGQAALRASAALGAAAVQAGMAIAEATTREEEDAPAAAPAGNKRRRLQEAPADVVGQQTPATSNSSSNLPRLDIALARVPQIFPIAAAAATNAVDAVVGSSQLVAEAVVHTAEEVRETRINRKRLNAFRRFN